MLMERREGYFQGILQLRDTSKEIEDFIRRDVYKHKEVFITKSPRVRGGVDIYLSDRKYLVILGKKLLKMFGGEMKSSVKLFSRDRQTSKNVYRVSVYFRPAQFRRGQVISFKNRVLQIISCSKKINAKDLAMDKKTVIKFDKEMKLIEPVYKTIVSKINPEIEVLDPETYQSVPTSNKKELKHGQKVKVVKFNNKVWLV